MLPGWTFSRRRDAATGHPELVIERHAMNDSIASEPAVSVSTSDLFVGFLKVGMSGFGGVMPFARRMLVEERRWLTEHEFTEVLSLSQFLPGPTSSTSRSSSAAASRGRPDRSPPASG